MVAEETWDRPSTLVRFSDMSSSYCLDPCGVVSSQLRSDTVLFGPMCHSVSSIIVCISRTHIAARLYCQAVGSICVYSRQVAFTMLESYIHSIASSSHCVELHVSALRTMGFRGLPRVSSAYRVFPRLTA